MAEPPAGRRPPLGVLGGTFDPVHLAHLHLARAALNRLRLGSVLWIPAGRPVLRDAPATSAADRLSMVRLAIADEPAFALDGEEALSDQPSYTVPTLERLRGIHGEEQPLVLLLGADAFLGLDRWHRWRDIFRLAHVAVAARPGSALDPAAMPTVLAEQWQRRRRSQFTALATAPAGTLVEFEIEPVKPVDLSATMVRERLRAAPETAAELLPPGVLDYIRRHHLYRA
jgi:nicotinate-nucleotide adenylyltransferase